MESTNNVSQEKNTTFHFNMIKRCAQLGEVKSNGNRKELNFISFNDKEPKWDIREWNSDHSKMSKGITLSDEELTDLGAAIAELLEGERPSYEGPSRPKNAQNKWGKKETEDEADDSAEDMTDDGSSIDDETGEIRNTSGENVPF